MMNKQEIFNKVVGHMRAQGNPWGEHKQRGWTFVNPENPCQRCAKGILMDVVLHHNQYRATSESLRLYNDWVREHRSGEEKEILAMLDSLENLFEDHPTETWESQFKYIANNYNVIMPNKNIVNVNLEQAEVNEIKL